MLNNQLAVVRGRYINRYEMQNYEPLVDYGFRVWGVGSLRPIHQNFKFPLIKLPSPVDLPDFPYKMPLLNRLFLGDAMWLFGLEKTLKQRKITVASGRETYFYFTYQLAKMRAKGELKRLVVTCSETKPFNHEGIWRRKQIKQFIRQNADIFHTLTVKAKKTLVKEGVNLQKIKVIPYGVDQKIFYPSWSKKRRRRLRVLFVGRLVEEKGIRDLVSIYNLLRRRGVDFELKVVGKGPLKKYLEKNGLSSLSYSYEKMPAVYRQADILLSLSHTTKYWEELFGMNLVEAMSSGVVPLAYRSRAIKEIVSNDQLLVKEGDYSGIAEKVINFIAHPQTLLNYKQKVYNLARERYDSRKQARKLGQLFGIK